MKKGQEVLSDVPPTQSACCAIGARGALGVKYVNPEGALADIFVKSGVAP